MNILFRPLIPIDLDTSGDASDEVFLKHLWVNASSSNTIFEDFPHATSALKPAVKEEPKLKPSSPPPRSSFSQFAKVKKEQARGGKRDVAVPARREGIKNRKTKCKTSQSSPPVAAASATAPTAATRAAPRGRRKSANDDVDSKLREMEEQLKNLDPNSKEAKKQRRLIRNRMSAQVSNSPE